MRECQYLRRIKRCGLIPVGVILLKSVTGGGGFKSPSQAQWLSLHASCRLHCKTLSHFSSTTYKSCYGTGLFTALTQ